MAETKVKFYRGKTWNPSSEGEPSNNGEIVMINDAMGDVVGDADGQVAQDVYDQRKKFGSVYQDDKIVGTTRADQLMITQDITVNDGEGGETIPAGTPVQTILTDILNQEKNTTYVTENEVSETNPISNYTISDNDTTVNVYSKETVDELFGWGEI